MPSRDPLGRTTAAEYAARCRPLGIAVTLRTNSIRVLRAFEAAFDRYGRTGAAGPEITFRILVDEKATSAPPWPAQLARGDGDLLYIAMGHENVVVADLRRRHAFGFISPAMAEDAPVLRTSFIECAVFAMATLGTGATHSYVHASAVAKDGRGFLFSGPCEAGKSTLAYACGRRGFRILSDDVVYLRNEPMGLTAWGRPWRLRLLRDCTRFFPELDGRPAPWTADDKIEIDVEEFLPGGAQTFCHPSALFFLQRSASRPSMEAIEPDAAVRLLARDLIADLPAVTDRHCRTWAQLAQRGAYLLNYGDDLQAAVDLVELFHQRSG